MNEVEPTGAQRRVKRGLGLLAIAGLGLVGWLIGFASMSVGGILGLLLALIGLVGMLATLGGLIGGLALIALGLLRD